MKKERIGVPYRLSFAGPPKGHLSQYKIGSGEAGWTVKYFFEAGKAAEFLKSLPVESRCPCYERALALLEK